MKIHLTAACAMAVLGSLLSGCWYYSNSGDSVVWHAFDESRGSTESKLLGVDPATFRKIGFHPLEEEWAVDSTHAWYQGRKVYNESESEPINIDPTSFEDLGGGYARDRAHVFFMNKMSAADAASFKVLGKSWGYDGKNMYFEGRRVPPDCSFEFDVNNMRKNQCETYRAKVS